MKYYNSCSFIKARFVLKDFNFWLHYILDIIVQWREAFPALATKFTNHYKLINLILNFLKHTAAQLAAGTKGINLRGLLGLLEVNLIIC